MTEEVTNLLRRALTLAPEAREKLASSLLKSLGHDSSDGAEAEWINKHREKAFAGLRNAGRSGFMEVRFRALDAEHSIEVSQPELLQAVEKASIHAFGWPIGIVLHTKEGRPRPMADGIVAEIPGVEGSYDYWALRTNADFYFLGSLFEDERTENTMWFDTRIMRITETFLFCYRLYKALGVDEENTVKIQIRHGGLVGRVLSSARPAVWALDRTSHEQEVEWRGTMQLARIREEFKPAVKKALDPLLMLFDFFQPPQAQVYSQIEEFLSMVSRQQEPFSL
jgi:hypothetical protein